MTAVQNWRTTVSMTDSSTFPRESQNIITRNFLPDKIANCLCSCSIISTATSGRISCCMISSVQVKTKQKWANETLMTTFAGFLENVKQGRYSNEKNLASLFMQMWYDQVYNTYSPILSLLTSIYCLAISESFSETSSNRFARTCHRFTQGDSLPLSNSHSMFIYWIWAPILKQLFRH